MRDKPISLMLRYEALHNHMEAEIAGTLVQELRRLSAENRQLRDDGKIEKERKRQTFAAARRKSR